MSAAKVTTNVAVIIVLVIVLIVRDRENSNEILKLKSVVQNECSSRINHRSKRDTTTQDKEAILFFLRKRIDRLLLDKINLLLPDVLKSMPARTLCQCENITETTVNVTHFIVNDVNVTQSRVNHNAVEEIKLTKCQKGERGPKGDQGSRGQKGERGLGLIEPQVRVADLNITAYIAGKMTLMCSFFGNPVPSVEWSVNGVNHDIKTKVIESSSEVISYFTISNISFHENHGNVSCSAKSILGQITKSGFIDVHVKPKVSFSSSIFYVDLASNVTFPTCNVLSNPPAKVTWRKGFGEIQKSRSVVSENGNFIITDVQVEDDGFYVCTAENYLGSDSVIIQLKTNPLKISHGSPTEAVLFNYPQTLWCGTYGRTEKISAKWRSLITNQVIEHTEFKTKLFLNTTIRITKGGTYSCEFTDGVTVIERISIIKSFIFPSNILKTPDEYKKIYELLKEVDAPTSSISQCMQMNEYSDYEVSSFWRSFQNCYYYKNTLVLVKVKDQNWILGGFTDIQWSNLQHLSSKKTFVFTTYPDFKIKTKDLSRTQPCLKTMSGRNYPCFGFQEFTFEELDISSNFGHKIISNYDYNKKYKAVIKSNRLLGSEMTVHIQNIEVFYLT
ncbi:uncharacterized protein LOC136080802 isoform X4 [Hydra vulgaris]|uniref:Uncharacterized protein LOC136080802 isoform X4 n=1 Tax=Hydra vulgaris TaxID=6087 RepID=A0ABM4BXX0_HYDVU